MSELLEYLAAHPEKEPPAHQPTFTEWFTHCVHKGTIELTLDRAWTVRSEAIDGPTGTQTIVTIEREDQWGRIKASRGARSA